jgi:hypothetical protein
VGECAAPARNKGHRADKVRSFHGLRRLHCFKRCNKALVHLWVPLLGVPLAAFSQRLRAVDTVILIGADVPSARQQAD